MDPYKYNQQPNVRSTGTGNLQLRKLWAIPDAKYIWALYQEYKTETCEMVEVDGKKTPDWNNITSTEMQWGTQQGFMGEEEWAKKTAEHFGIEFPEEEYKED